MIASWLPSSVLARYRVFKYQIRKAQQSADEPELKLLPAFGGDGNFVDVGANIGSWSIRAAKLFRQVFVFEPDKNVSALLRATMPGNVVVHAVALSDHSGVAQLSVPLLDGKEVATRASLQSDANPGFSEVRREVSTATLDSYRLHGISVIKIDVEGHEAFVLDGAKETIARERPVLIVEVEERHHPGRSHEVFDRLLRQDYVCRFIRDNRLNQFDTTMITELQPVEMEPEVGFKHANYVNNFVFIPQERSQILATMAGLLASGVEQNARK